MIRSKWLMYFDLFHQEIGFLEQGKRHFRTWFGVFLSICVFILSFVLSVMFGKDLVLKNKPSVAMSEEFNEASKVEMKKWPVFIILFSAFNEQIENFNDYYTIKTYKSNYTDPGIKDFDDYTPFYPTVRCNKSHFDSIKEISQQTIDEFLSHPIFCVDYDNDGYFQNPYISSNSTFLDIEIQICNRTERKCADDLEDFVNMAYLDFHFVNTFIDSFDYSNPVKYFYDLISFQLTNTLLKRTYINISNNKYISDNGWILEATSEISFYKLYNVVNDVNTVSISYPLDVLWLTFDSPNIVTIYKRVWKAKEEAGRIFWTTDPINT